MARKPRTIVHEEDEKAPKPPKEEKSPKRAIATTPAEYMRRLKSVVGEDEEDNFVFFDDPGVDTTVTEWISTGCIAIDRMTGGGWPIGRISEVAAWEHVGKSTLLDQSIAQCQKMGGIVLLIDSESARDTKYSQALGVKVEDVIVRPVKTLEGAFDAIDEMLGVQESIVADLKGKIQPPPLLIVLDSVAGLPTLKELETGNAQVMDAAKLIKSRLRQHCLRFPKLRTAFVFSNHFYESPQALSFGPQLKTYGGSGIRYYASLRLWLSRVGKLTATGDVEVGHLVEAKIKKTKIMKPRPPATTGLVWGAGYDNSVTLYEWGKSVGVSSDHTWVRVRGSWSYLMMPDGTYEAFQGGFRGFGALLAEKPALYEQLANQYLTEGA